MNTYESTETNEFAKMWVALLIGFQYDFSVHYSDEDELDDATVTVTGKKGVGLNDDDMGILAFHHNKLLDEAFKPTQG